MDKTHPNWRAECGLVSEINPETGLAEWAPPGMHSPGDGSTPSSSATAPSQPVPVVVQGAVVVPSSNAEPPMGLPLLPTGPSSYGQPAYGGAMVAPAPHPSYGQPAYGGTVQTPYGQPAIAPAPQPMAAPAPQQVSLTGS